MKVLITSNSFGKYSSQPMEILKSAGFEVVLNPYHRVMNEEEFMHEIKDADAVILSTENLNRRVIDQAPLLKVVSRYGVGTDNIDKEYCRQKGIPVTITKDSNNNAVAEYAVALMLATLRKIPIANDYARKGEWKKFTGLDLSGKTVGIAGLGSIGKEVVKKLKSLNVSILVYDVNFDEAFINEYKIEKSTFNDLISRSDIISLHMPGIGEKPLLGDAEFRMMKQDCVLINTARASLIDTDALVSALESGRVYGAALDVHPQEPAFDERLCAMENVILTPHNAAVSREAVDKMSMSAARNVIDLIGDVK